MGSSETRAKGERTSAQLAFPAASKVARRVWFPDSMKTAPLFQFTPMDGSPAPRAPFAVDPSGAGMFSSAGAFAYFGAPGGVFGTGRGFPGAHGGGGGGGGGAGARPPGGALRP